MFAFPPVILLVSAYRFKTEVGSVEFLNPLTDRPFTLCKNTVLKLNCAYNYSIQIRSLI